MPMDSEQGLEELHDQVLILTQREPDPHAVQEVERRFEVLAAEVRADAPLVDVARAAGTGLILEASRWADLGGSMASSVGRLLTLIDSGGAAVSPPIYAGEELAAAGDAAEAEASPDEIGGPIYGGEGIGGPIYPDDE